MKSITQIVAFLAVVIGGIFGVTFLTQYTRNASGPKAGPAPAPTNRSIDTYEVVAVWDPQDSAYVKETERNVRGHYDYLVSNPNNVPATLSLNGTSCKCTSVLFAVLQPDVQDKLKDKKPLPAGTQLEPYLAGIQWEPILREKGQPAKSVQVPAADGAPRFAVIRLEFDAKDPQVNRLTADFHARAGSANDYFKFEVPIIIVPPVGVYPEQITIGDFKSGETRDTTFYIWSATRDKFTADAQLSAADPCITIAPPRLLSDKELKELPDKLGALGFAHKTRPKLGYEIKVNLAERRGDDQLELGPFARRIIVNRGTESELFVVLTGTVRGPIQISEDGTKDINDRIDFRIFRADRLTDKTIDITSSDPNLKLTVDHVKPETLNVELKEIKSSSGSRSWKLNVLVPADTQAGRFPNDSAIYLKTNSTPPRRIRIPVVGDASG